MTLRSSQIRLLSHSVLHVVLIAGSLLMVIPLLWTLSTSLKSIQQISVWPPEWIPDPVMWSNYVEVFKAVPVLLWLRNSLVIVAANVVGSVVTCSFVAYGFARLRFPGRDALFLLMLSTLMMPYIVRLIPLYVLYNQVGWINTFLPVTVPQLLARNPFFIFLLRQFFMGIPDDLSDAARIDGANEFQIWWRIVMPLSKPALAAVAIFAFRDAWEADEREGDHDHRQVDDERVRGQTVEGLELCEHGWLLRGMAAGEPRRRAPLGRTVGSGRSAKPKRPVSGR